MENESTDYFSEASQVRGKPWLSSLLPGQVLSAQLTFHKEEKRIAMFDYNSALIVFVWKEGSWKWQIYFENENILFMVFFTPNPRERKDTAFGKAMTCMLLLHYTNQ